MSTLYIKIPMQYRNLLDVQLDLRFTCYGIVSFNLAENLWRGKEPASDTVPCRAILCSEQGHPKTSFYDKKSL